MPEIDDENHEFRNQVEEGPSVQEPLENATKILDEIAGNLY